MSIDDWTDYITSEGQLYVNADEAESTIDELEKEQVEHVAAIVKQCNARITALKQQHAALVGAVVKAGEYAYDSLLDLNDAVQLALAQQDQPGGDAVELVKAIIADLDRWWKFDGQEHAHTWHEKQDFFAELMNAAMGRPSLLTHVSAALAQQDQPAGEWITINEDGSNLPERTMSGSYMVAMLGPLGYRRYVRAAGSRVAELFYQRPLRAVAYRRCDERPRSGTDYPEYTPPAGG